ncbi:hypothetical protein IJK16_01920 [Candidatus Saccharibacteria bacterium]|jgi:hypothetical protein|nr:hypothetical protein [Candidatus Saccharibacteria bacterium]
MQINSLLKKIAPLTKKKTGPVVQYQLPYAQLINAESFYGRTIFGPIPAGHQREFFEQTKNVWVWYESWTEQGVKKESTIRYEVRPDGVYKKPLGGKIRRIYGDELDNFRMAALTYLKLIKANLYHK